MLKCDRCLMNARMDICEVVKIDANKTHQNSPSSLRVRPSFSFSFWDTPAHSGDLESIRDRDEVE